LIVGDAVAEAADHRSDLGIENRRGNQSAQMIDDLDILSRRVEDLGHRLVAHEIEKGGKVHSRREGIDQRRNSGSRKLNQAEFRPEGRLADEFGIDRYKTGSRQAIDSFLKFLR